ncbi:hypothetical protein HFC70_14925 [Agrobacterium sp. a22-2]|uniref:hypothetical protein n=1 Tax=Agrobacterium sp. a22-2 TaxID=2283840 RepID=UPI001446E3E0|nr:hypothetical protein [Agrobacterium sp. a22-2]NKN37644.1 hypothetical protein [Agrobacterium sp. a22-2]
MSLSVTAKLSAAYILAVLLSAAGHSAWDAGRSTEMASMVPADLAAGSGLTGR